jgi:hypothetical protein
MELLQLFICAIVSLLCKTLKDRAYFVRIADIRQICKTLKDGAYFAKSLLVSKLGSRLSNKQRNE